jgi:hypothetical protein
MRLTYTAKVILLVGIGLGTLAVAYYTGIEKSKRVSLSLIPTQVSSTSNFTTTPSPTPTIIPEIDTSDWKTYRNEKYGFEFNYPGDWNISDSDTEYNLGASFVKDILKHEKNGTYMFEFFIFNNPSDQKWYTVNNLDQVEYITIDNKISAIKGQEKYEGFPALVSIWTYNSKGYLFRSIPRMAEEPRFKEIFDKILSSFKFIN